VRTDLPTGTVTFLFTDVEGSTQLLHELGAEPYAEALADHRRLIREACTAEGGVEVDTQGDAFFFAFASAPSAIAAAEAMTEELAAGPIQVRIGLHTGTPLLAEEGYVGDDVHFAARVAASGHGGQVILSAATAEVVELALTELGEHRLKDIAEAVPIFQLGDGSFPPLKTISNTNLPRPVSSFVGRDDELLEVLSRFEDGARLVTLTGPGGTGKTRLAIEAASELVPEYKAGVFWVGLAALRDPALVSETIAQTLGAKDGLAGHLAERELLLLLDNLEQVIEAAPELSELLTACPNLTLLVTSRELLRVQGEVEYAVPPLVEPEAVSLFCERSQLEPSEEISALCVRLDSLPLAVELAAARTKALSPAQILERLSGRLDLLKGGRDADPRQQTLRATIEWSYELLTPEEQQLFACLSVFAGGCTLEAAEDVCDADLDTLQSLVEKSLLRFTGGRYWMLETIREYAAERLAGAGELAARNDRLVEYVLRLVDHLDSRLADAEGATLTSELDNFRAAFVWTDQGGRRDWQLDLIGNSWPFWWYRGSPSEGMTWVESALSGGREEHGERRMRVVTAGAMFSYRRGDLAAMKAYADKSLGIARELADEAGTIWPLIFLGLWASELRDHSNSITYYEQAIAAARRCGNRYLEGIVLNNQGVVAQLEGDRLRAAALFEEALTIFRDIGLGDDVALLSLNLADSLMYVGRTEEAAEVARDGLSLARGTHSHIALMHGVEVVAAFAERRGDAEAATRLLGAADGIRMELGDVEQRSEAEERRRLEAMLRDALGAAGYVQVLEEGRRMSLDEAVEYALASID
jgi:predicted ATPase